MTFIIISFLHVLTRNHGEIIIVKNGHKVNAMEILLGEFSPMVYTVNFHHVKVWGEFSPTEYMV